MQYSKAMLVILFLAVIACLFTNTEESRTAAQRQLPLLKSVLYTKDLARFTHFHKVLEGIDATTPVTYTGRVIFIARMTNCKTSSKIPLKEVYQNCEETGSKLNCTLTYHFHERPEDYGLVCDPIA
ncbi:hypothetical protein T07_3174 [Trichinella nelsoni]|uniref:Uncharacterized protein n=1 Tax=Trichinella nelsoni TaxID=6336 RepID=A0A0V0SMB2_9BILA|nr:hypothetical protein T07_3174 [Trichinella nelsoni]